MCGIIGYVGRQEAAPILLEGLERMEYRGYDSTGMAVCGDGVLRVCKKKGRVQVLREMSHDGADLPGTLGIGHTRWATVPWMFFPPSTMSDRTCSRPLALTTFSPSTWSYTANPAES